MSKEKKRSKKKETSYTIGGFGFSVVAYGHRARVLLKASTQKKGIVMAHSRLYAKIMSSSRWQKLQAATLQSHPYCERCKDNGRLTPSKVVHHIQPIESGHSREEYERLAYDPQNLQALCQDCHSFIHSKEIGSYTKAGRLHRQRDRQLRWLSDLQHRFTKNEQ